jgi:hypothetical protein
MRSWRFLLWMAGLDALNANAQPQPPNREFAQVEQRLRRSKRNAVIAPDVGRQTTLLKKPFNTVKAYSSFVEDSASRVSR